MARIAFLTCHLSGSGHLVRTLTLARAAREAGHQVMVLNGGRPLGHIDNDPALVQLPPVTIRGLEFKVLRRPAFMPVPGAALKLALGREMATELLLASARVMPTRLQSAGFEFLYPDLEDCLRMELGKLAG